MKYGYEYELIEHNYISGFHLFIVEIMYRSPHIHRDFEVDLVMKGEVTVCSQGAVYRAAEGDFFVLDPYRPHELRSEGGPVRILSIQVSPAFFSGFFPSMDAICFHTTLFHRDEGELHRTVVETMLQTARLYCKKDPFYGLDCARQIIALFRALPEISDFTIANDADRSARHTRQERIRYLSEQVEARCCEKLLLGDLARELGVNLYYLSHFFRENFGVSFQEYLSKLRCEKARRELVMTDRTLLEISMACGFSSPKYLNRAFLKQFGATPSAYRRTAHRLPLSPHVASLMTRQVFLTDKECLKALDE